MAILPQSDTPIYDELAEKYHAKELYERVFNEIPEELPPNEPIGVNIGQ